jgi:hypothetical protein
MKTKHFGVFVTPVLLVCMIAIIGFSACSTDAPSGGAEAISGERSITVDLPESIFNPYNAVIELDRGLDAQKVEVVITTASGEYAATVTRSGSSYQQTSGGITTSVSSVKSGYIKVLSPVVTGVLQKVSVKVTGGTPTADRETEITSWNDTANYVNWERFENLLKFKLKFTRDKDTKDEGGTVTAEGPRSISLEPGLQGGDTLGFRYDVGPRDTLANLAGGYPVFTTVFPGELKQGEIAFQPEWQENGSDLYYDLYLLVTDEDIPSLYDPRVGSEAKYHDDLWSQSWTYDQVVKGRYIGGRAFKPQLLSGLKNIRGDGAVKITEADFVKLGATEGGLGWEADIRGLYLWAVAVAKFGTSDLMTVSHLLLMQMGDNSQVTTNTLWWRDNNIISSNCLRSVRFYKAGEFIDDVAPSCTTGALPSSLSMYTGSYNSIVKNIDGIELIFLSAVGNCFYYDFTGLSDGSKYRITITRVVAASAGNPDPLSDFKVRGYPVLE